MTIQVQFFSYFRELAGTPQTGIDLPENATLGRLIDQVLGQYPRLEPMRNSMLKAVGVEYQQSSHILRPGDTVSLFPPVQGG